MTLFEKFDEVLNEKLIDSLKKLGDRNLGDTQGAIHAIFYTLLAGLIRRANSEMSTGMLVNQIRKISEKNFGDKKLSELLESDKDVEYFVNVGEKNMSQIFPSFRSQLISLIVSNSGTGKNETTKYAGFVNSFLVRYLAEKLDGGMEKEDLINYLREHRDPLFEKAPSALVDKMIPAMGMQELRSMKMTVAKKAEEKKRKEEDINNNEEGGNTEVEYEEETSSTSYEYEPERKSYMKPILIAVGVLLLGALAFFLYQSKDELFGESEPSETAIMDEALLDSLMTDTTQNMEPEVVGDPAISAFKGLLAAESLANGDEFRVQSLSFEKGAVELTNPANPILDTLLAEFKSNPRFQIQIKGGDSNKSAQIGLRRAFFLKRLLQNKGVDPLRVDAIADSENLDYLKVRIVSK